MFLHLLNPQPDWFGAHDARQFACTRGAGARDAAFVVCFATNALSSGRRVLSHWPDVSGAVNRVDAPRLLARLRGFSVPESELGVVASWLKRRAARSVYK
eukprot:278612-Pyramimonas_sp.AAC.2